MNTKVKYCDTCNELMVDSEDAPVKLFLHLVKGTAEIDICSDCCEIGTNKPFEQKGFKQELSKGISNNVVI